MPSSAFAEVLGTPASDNATDLGGGTVMHRATFEGGAGQQTEYYVEYTPNDTAIPVVENGYAVWGSKNLYRAASYIEKDGYRPLIGMNGDFFSFDTGIPMGLSVADGEILTKTDDFTDAIGFRSDGTAFIDRISVSTTLYLHEEAANIECINRWYTKTYTPICLLTDKFSDSTHTGHSCLYLICTPTEGSLSIGKTQKLRVDEKFVYDGNVEIPQGKMLLMISSAGVPELYKFLDAAEIGDELEVKNEVYGKPEWNEAQSVIGSTAGKLLTNGQIVISNDGEAAPRTAVGMRADGTVIFYTLDGRQRGYSYGAQLETLAARMAELGCVEAINLDGGGSTAMGGVLPGSTDFTLFSSPSDGRLRDCGNYIFLRDNRGPTGIPNRVTFSDTANKNFLDGNTLEVSFADLVDTNGYPMAVNDYHYEVENTGGAKSTISDNGIYTMKGNGRSTVKLIVNGTELTGFTYDVFAEPDNVVFVDDGSGRQIDEIYLNPNESTTIDIGAYAYVNGVKLHAYDVSYDWSVEGDIGTVDAHGVYSAKTNGDKAGKIVLRKGGYEKDLNVFVSDYDSETESAFADISGHWAQQLILRMADSNIINGIELDGRTYFKPDDSMTRAQFAQVIAKSEGLLTGDLSGVSLPYTDAADIQPWAQNAVKAMYKNGIMSGRSNDSGKTFSFDADASITRSEAMTVLGRLIPDAKIRRPDFTDSMDIYEWAYEGISRLYGEGVIQGYSDGSINPNGNITRAEAISMMSRLPSK